MDIRYILMALLLGLVLVACAVPSMANTTITAPDINYNPSNAVQYAESVQCLKQAPAHNSWNDEAQHLQMRFESLQKISLPTDEQLGYYHYTLMLYTND